jgi:hypothetical protein
MNKYFWMTELKSAKIGKEDWPITVDTIIFDTGSSINHIPIKDFNFLMVILTRDHKCKTLMNPQETYYCACNGANDQTYPVLKLKSNNVTLNFNPSDYLVFEKINAKEYACLVSFQREESPINTNYWILGDSFMRAFYTIYDVENKRIGLVGDTDGPKVDLTVPDKDSPSNFNMLIYILPGVICLLCFIAICITAFIVYRLRKRQLTIQ